MLAAGIRGGFTALAVEWLVTGSSWIKKSWMDELSVDFSPDYRGMRIDFGYTLFCVCFSDGGV